MEGEDRDRHTELQPGTVLVVAPDPGLAELYSLWLSDFYETRTAYSGTQAIDTLDESIDVILLDSSIQGISGEELLERIRADEVEVRIAVISRKEPAADIEDLIADEYITKPVDSERIKAAVESLLRRPKRSGFSQELVSLVSRKLTLEAQAATSDLAEKPDYRRHRHRIENLTGGSELVVHRISSKFRPDVCPDCDLRWDISVAGAVGFLNLGSHVWKCTRCGHVVHYTDPHDRRVARR